MTVATLDVPGLVGPLCPNFVQVTLDLFAPTDFGDRYWQPGH
jgi:hypothetical protein